MAKSIIEKAKQDDQFFHLEDGFMYYFPCKYEGGLSAENLRELADYLDAQNKELQDNINEYFKDWPNEKERK